MRQVLPTRRQGRGLEPRLHRALVDLFSRNGWEKTERRLGTGRATLEILLSGGTVTALAVERIGRALEGLEI